MRSGEEHKTEVLAALQRLAHERQADENADETARFLTEYYEDAAPDDVVGIDPLDLYGAALAHRELARQRAPEVAAVRVVAPSFDVDGWASRHTAVQVVTDDMPFVVDSVRMAITRHGLGIHVLHHPIIGGESMVHVEVDRHADADADELADDIRAALSDVRVAVGDGSPMVDDLRSSIERLLVEGADHVPEEELAEAVAFLRWLADDNFTFLGVRSYELAREDDAVVVHRVAGSGLGVLRRRWGSDRTELSPTAGRLALEPVPLVLTKANSMATVHRSSLLDYVGVKRFDAEGRVVGERRYLGLYTSRMYTASVSSIPLLRRKVELVVDRAGFALGTHSSKDLRAILETYPRDELVQTDPEDLYETVIAIQHLQERRLTRLFLRPDAFGRFWSALVYLPRDRYNTDSRLAVESVLREALQGWNVTSETRVSDSSLARLHYVIMGDAADLEVDVDALEDRVAAAVRDWRDDLHDLLVEIHGEDAGVVLAQRYGNAFSAGYRADNPARTAVADIARLEHLDVGDIDFHLYRRPESGTDELRLRVYRSGQPVLVSDLVPVLEDLGARVSDLRPYRVHGDFEQELHIYDIGMRVPELVDVHRDEARVVEMLRAVWSGHAQSDRLNQLALTAGLSWWDIRIVRAYSRYLRQTSIPFSPEYVEDCITAHPYIVGALVQLFHAQFQPPGDAASAAELDTHALSMLDEIASLDEDRVLRSMLSLARATLRTNAHQVGADGERKPYLSFKFDPGAVRDLPLPRPHREIFVFSPRVEGVHLRGAPVARGGLRWSDRREDYRTEVLGLMKAQMVKNAVIVPAGAKGGFVVKQAPDDPAERRDEVVACYRLFVSGLLDITDSLEGDEIVPPSDVIRRDDADPYLVVAADKGTATLSDTANEVAADYGFWLGDAFASGGSAGYDHKAMAITARGAWESVKRHFHRVDVDVQREPVTVVGIGDMGGDVFGNGMLLSPHLRLLGAFDHRHVFLDPDPDPAVSFAERRRLFGLDRSSWDDYDRSAISPGGLVVSRAAKRVDLTPAVKDLLGVDADVLAPDEVIHALLQAPVDLLWNGGIGTYVKASTESHADVGDKTNDNLRVDATQLQCRVVAEGGNLGMTQRSRIQFARSGGLVNTDAIDNSAGVDCSDHEVNIKIVLDAVVGNGDLTTKQRNELLASMTDEVADLVLAHNVRQNQTLVNAVVQAPSLVDVHLRYLRSLEAAGQIDRSVEFLPTDDELTERKAEGQGLTAPEFAVLLAYTKNLLTAELLRDDLPDDPWCERLLFTYFPSELRGRAPDHIRRHRLRREIIATILANEVVDHQGTTALYRLRDETGASATEATRALVASTEIFDLRRFRAAVVELDGRISSPTQTRMLLEARKLAERGARWLLRSPPHDSLGAVIERFAPGVSALADALPAILEGNEKIAFDELTAELVDVGVPDPTAQRAASFSSLFGGLDCVELASASGHSVEHVAAVRAQLEERLGIGWLIDQVSALPRENRWQTLARLSLREDVQTQLRRLTGLVIDAGDRAAAPHEQVGTWCAAHDAETARLLQLLSEIRATGPADLATLSVGLRELSQLVSRD